MELIHRIRVEKRPDEDHRRFYPECAVSVFDCGVITPDGEIQWGALGTKGVWYKCEDDARYDIDMDIKLNNVRNMSKSGGYTVEIIDYPKKAKADIILTLDYDDDNSGKALKDLGELCRLRGVEVNMKKFGFDGVIININGYLQDALEVQRFIEKSNRLNQKKKGFWKRFFNFFKS